MFLLFSFIKVLSRHCERCTLTSLRAKRGNLTKKPHMNAERSQKHKNIDMLTVAFCAAAYVNILAFFSVVASSQISPHFFLSGCKDTQKIQPSKNILDGMVKYCSKVLQMGNLSIKKYYLRRIKLLLTN